MESERRAATRSTANAEVNRGASSSPDKPPLSHGRSKRPWRISHERMKGDDSLWLTLLFAGIQHDGIGGLIENRLCPCCGSTLSRSTTALHAVQIVATLSGIHSRSLDAIVDAGEAAQRIES